LEYSAWAISLTLVGSACRVSAYASVWAGRSGTLWDRPLYSSQYSLRGCLVSGGRAGDRVNKKTLLCVGYALFGVMCLLFLTNPTSIPMLALLFILAGVYVGIVDAMERALAADLLPIGQRAVGYGALATATRSETFCRASSSDCYGPAYRSPPVLVTPPCSRCSERSSCCSSLPAACVDPLTGLRPIRMTRGDQRARHGRQQSMQGRLITSRRARSSARWPSGCGPCRPRYGRRSGSVP